MQQHHLIPPQKGLLMAIGSSTLDRAAMHILLWVCAINSIVLPAVFAKLMFYPSNKFSVEAASPLKQTAAMPTSPTLTQYGEYLSDTGLNPTITLAVTHPALTIKGVLIAVDNDNIQVFEFPDTESALQAASILKEKYESSNRDAAWKESIHIHTDNTLLIFYMGNNQRILSAIDRFELASRSE
jgi:hypothetical protein